MPTQKASFKHLRQTKKRTVKNRAEQERMKGAIKKVQRAAAAKQVADLETLIRTAVQAIDKAAQHGIIKKNTAARKKSRIMRKAHALRQKP